ncbi:MAG: hypothetical protein HKN32_02125, partial [Flavobacteriales bacterium]|nr:hypothetical protein [Flavobacteriales bacterium]
MKFKFLLLSVSALVCFGFVSLLSSPEKVAEYSPRESDKIASSAEGMEWIYKKLRGNLETGEIEPQDWYEVRNAAMDHKRSQGANRALDLGWIEMGPDNIGGRTRALLIMDDMNVFAGSCSGGLWKSTNGVNSW